MSLFKVILGKTIVKDGIVLPYNQSTYTPSINFDPIARKYYTIIMVDPDAPAKYMLHYLTINNGEVVADYHPPRPPIGDGLHRYMFYLLEQPKEMDINDVKRYIGENILKNRGNFNFGDFFHQFNFKNVDHTYFRTERIK